MVTASTELANFIKNPTPEKIVPTMEEWELYPVVASAVASKTVEMGLARKTDSKAGFYKRAREIIETNRNIYSKMMEMGFIKGVPDGKH